MCRLLPIFLALSFAAVVLDFSPRAAQPDAEIKQTYLNPLDVSVDEKGTTAWVALAGSRKMAVVDLKSGTIGKTTDHSSWEPTENPIVIHSESNNEEGSHALRIRPDFYYPSKEAYPRAAF